MKYIVMVSHGMFAPGLHNALGMLAGKDREDILSTSLKDGMGADEFAENFRKMISVVKEDDEIILFADLLGGSPLSTSANVLAEMGLLGRTKMFTGMNLPLVLGATLMKDDMDTEEMKEEMLSDAQDGIQEFTVAVEESSEDDI
ncbi:MAG: PTS fructose transporter subunit IIA [Lachnospiraceae bacterium]|nr:PTS fructose transporter subunit IIA [Lachnospiraceae bacterium]